MGGGQARTIIDLQFLDADREADDEDVLITYFNFPCFNGVLELGAVQ